MYHLSMQIRRDFSISERQTGSLTSHPVASTDSTKESAIPSPSLDSSVSHYSHLSTQWASQRNAPIWSEPDSGASALNAASSWGRFDIVRCLLQEGADETRLGWTPLMRAVALGTLNEVKSQLKKESDLSKRDAHDRTPYLLSLSGGDLEKAKLLFAAGANPNDTGQSGNTALMVAVDADNPHLLKWLLATGADIEATNDFGKTALMEAASRNAVHSARTLLDAGADPDKTDHDKQSAIFHTSSPEIIRLLAASGQDLNDLSPQARASLLGLEYEGELLVTRTEFEAGKLPRFGSANPEKMEVPFWHAMVSSGATAQAARHMFVPENKHYDKDEAAPIWSYHREGKSINELPDGRFIEIGGGHEDWYDSDFHIYNEVFVHHPDGHFDIYGYPAEVFPTTDFHSATLVNDSIYIIGCLGHPGERIIGCTPVYRLNTQTFAIEKINTIGELPGCISMHEGTLKNNEIYVCGGECTEAFILNLDTHHWRREVN